MTNLEKARRFFEGDKYATAVTGIKIEEVAEDYAKCSLAIKDCHKNAIGAVMGGVIFTIADFCFAVATNFNKPYITVTTTSQISYLETVKGNKIYAESKLLKSGRTTCFYQIDITDELENLVAVVMVSGNKISK